MVVAKEVYGITMYSWENAPSARDMWLRVVADPAMFEELSRTQSAKDLHALLCKAMGGNTDWSYDVNYYEKFIEELKWFREYVHPPENSLMGKRFRLLVSKRRFEFICNGTLTGEIKFLDGKKEKLTMQMKDLREISEEE